MMFNNVTGLVGGAAVFGIVAGLWQHIKAFFYRFYSLFVVHVKVSGPAGYAMSMYLIRNFKRSRIGDIEIDGYNEYIRPLQMNQLVALQCISSKSMLWRKGWRWLGVSRQWSELTLTFPRGMFDPLKLAAAAVHFFNDDTVKAEKSARFFVKRKQGSVGVKPMLNWSKSSDGGGGDKLPSADIAESGESRSVSRADKYTSQPLGWAFEDLGQPIAENAIDLLSLSAAALEMLDDIKRFYTNRAWFKEHSVPWKFGALLTGAPGTGKTAYVGAVGQRLGLPIFVLDLATMTNQDLVAAWISLRDWTPCAVLIEDIHTVFKGTENITRAGDEAALNFDCLLNMLDGVENSEGILTFITTNCRKSVDVALGGGNGDVQCTRPGRINRVLAFNVLDEVGRQKMADRIMNELPVCDRKRVVQEHASVTGAQFQDICTTIALKNWERLIANKMIERGVE